MVDETRKGGNLYDVDQLVKKVNSRLESFVKATSNPMTAGGLTSTAAQFQIDVEILARAYGLQTTTKKVTTKHGTVEIRTISRSKQNLTNIKTVEKKFKDRVNSPKFASFEERALSKYMKQHPEIKKKHGKNIPQNVQKAANSWYKEVQYYNSVIDTAYEIYRQEMRLEAENEGSGELNESTLDILNFWRGGGFEEGGISITHNSTETQQNELRGLVEDYVQGSHLWTTKNLGSYAWQEYTNLLTALKKGTSIDEDAKSWDIF